MLHVQPSQAAHISSPPQSQPSHSAELEVAPSRIRKRIIVCCDGTWLNGVESQDRSRYSNVLKLTRLINRQDNRQKPPIPQIVFYQAGVGSEHNLYSEWVEGATGSSLFEKVHEVYGFIAHNYQEGDELFLFGFSRGAYTARMTAHFIGEMGVLDRHDMEYFPKIFMAYQTKNKPKHRTASEIADAEKVLAQYEPQIANSKRRADVDGSNFSITCLGVFDTVGSLGLPTELSLSRKTKHLFAFPDNNLGPNVHHGFHAMALNETRVDFDVTLFEQTQEGRDRGQVLKQVWFAGSHTDIGGGYRKHELSDISLIWMVSNLEELLSLDLEYLRRIPEPITAWGAQRPHNSKKGIFKLCRSKQRALPPRSGVQTHEYIHPSVKHQSKMGGKVMALIDHNPGVLWELTQLEEKMKDMWPSASPPADADVTHKMTLGRVIMSAANTISRVSRNIMGQGKEVGELAEGGREAATQARPRCFGGFITNRLSSAFFSKI